MLLLISLPLLGLYEGSEFKFAQLIYDGNWDTRPRAYKRLMSTLELRTSVNSSDQRKSLRLTDPDLFQYPFLYMSGDSSFTSFSAQERRKLRKYLQLGGTLIIDDTSGEQDSSFDTQIRAELVNIMPEIPLAPIPHDHVVNKSFYILNSASGRKVIQPYLEGITFREEDRTAVLYSKNDLGGAWSEDEFGKWQYEVIPGGEAQRERAFRLGINMILYALTGNYKKDQVHTPFIKRRQMNF
ncbi:MAG: DUF4159 domain-containing protein [Thermodesulfobacteriota bacterium]